MAKFCWRFINMSRLGKKPIKIPDNVEIIISKKCIKAKGPKGEIEYQIPPRIEVDKKDGKIIVQSPIRKKTERTKYGLARASIANIIKGVNKGFRKKMEINGVGYNIVLEGDKLKLNLGYSHPVNLTVPEGLGVDIKKNNITISGIDKNKVGQFASIIRKQRSVEPYKGKGIKYKNEVVVRKVGKAALKAEGEGAE